MQGRCLLFRKKGFRGSLELNSACEHNGQTVILTNVTEVDDGQGYPVVYGHECTLRNCCVINLT